MSVQQRLMLTGAWGISFKKEAPAGVRSIVGEFDNIVILSSRVDPRLYDDATMLSNAKYTGVVLEIDNNGFGTRMRISGSGLEWYLADGENKGLIFESVRSYDTDAFSEVLNRSASTPYGLLRSSTGGTTAIEAGTIGSVTGTYTGSHHLESQKQVLKKIMDHFGAEYRLNNDGTIDAGYEADLFVTTPEAVIVRRNSGNDPNVKGVSGHEMRSDRNARKWASRIVLIPEGEGDTISVVTADAATNPYKDIHGNALMKAHVITESSTPTANATTRAAELMDKVDYVPDKRTLNTNDYDVEGSFSYGDTVHVFDPSTGIEDTTNPIQYRGETIYPDTIRVVGIEWPILEGMGVYIRDNVTGAYTDISDYIEFEDGGVKLELGDPEDPITTDLTNAIISDRVYAVGAGEDTTTPDVPAVANTPWGSSIEQDDQGASFAEILVDWTEPTNTDLSAITDGNEYKVRYRVTGNSEWYYVSVPWDTTTARLTGLHTGTSYDIGVAAYDNLGKSNGFSASEVVVTGDDGVAPSQPAAPILTSKVLAIEVSHTLGKQTGGTYNLETDIAYLEVHMSVTTGFTPDASTQVAQIGAIKASIDQARPVHVLVPRENATTYYCKVIAVDWAGNASASSPQTSAVALLVDTPNIANEAIEAAQLATNLTFIDVVSSFSVSPAIGDTVYLTVADDPGDGGGTRQPGMWSYDGSLWEPGPADGSLTDNHIAANTITAGSISAGAIGADELAANEIYAKHLVIGNFDNLCPNPGFELSTTLEPGVVKEAGGLVWEVSSTVARSGGKSLQYNATVAQTLDAEYSLLGAWNDTDTGVTCAEGDSFTAWAYIRDDLAAASNDCALRIYWIDENGTQVGTATTGTFTEPTTTWAKIIVSGTAPAGVAYMHVVAVVRDDGNSNDVFFDDFYIRQALDGSIVVDGTIDTNQLAANSIVAGKIDTNAISAAAGHILDLSADDINTGSMSAARITTGTMSADRISTGSIDATNVTITNLNATNISSGTMNAARIGAGTIGVEIIKLSNSASSRIESFDGTSLIVKGDGSFTATSATIAGAITATSLSLTGTLSVDSGGVIVSGATTARHWTTTALAPEKIQFKNSSTAKGEIGLAAGYEFALQSFNLEDIWIHSASEIDFGVSGTAQGNRDYGMTSDYFVCETNYAPRLRRTTPTAVGTPAYSFRNDTNTGMLRSGAGTIGLVTAGTETFTLSSAVLNVNVSGAATIDGGSGVYLADDGTNVARFYYDGTLHVAQFDTNDFFLYYPASDQWQMRIGGTTEFLLGATGFKVPNVYNATQSGTANVLVTTDGSLKRATSSIRLKKDPVRLADYRRVLDMNAYEWDGMEDRAITKTDDEGNEVPQLWQSGPRKGRVKREIVETGIRQAGMIAEDAYKAHKLFAVEDETGKPGSLDLAAIVAAQLEVLKDQDVEITDLKTRIEELEQLLTLNNIM